MAHQEGGVRRRDLCLAHKRRSIHQMDFEDELEKRILELGFTKDHPPNAILEFGMENLRQIAFKIASEDKYTNIEEIQNWRFSNAYMKRFVRKVSFIKLMTKIILLTMTSVTKIVIATSGVNEMAKK